jgi:subfamily B ATP-binding cassette protein MsbA
MLAVAALEPLLPMMMKPLLDSAENTDFFVQPTWLPYVLLGLITLLSLFSYGRSYLGGWLNVTMQKKLRDDMTAHLLRLPLNHRQTETLGKTTSRFMAFVPALASPVLPVFTALVQETVKTAVYLSWMFYLQWKLACIVLVAVPFVSLLIKILGTKMKIAATRAQRDIAASQSHLNETVRLLPIIKLASDSTAEHSLRDKFSSLRGAQLRQQIVIAAGQPLSQMIIAIPSAVILVYVVDALLNAQMSSGDVAAFVGVMLLMPRSVRVITRSTSIFEELIVAAREISYFLGTDTEIDNGKTTIARAQGAIAFENISFAYNQNTQLVLDDVSLTLAPGETVALVGRSGAGKTTLANLLPRFYTPTAGVIRLDNHDLREISLASLRHQIALVTQEPLLFDDTVAINVAYPDGGAADIDKVERALKNAAANDFVAALPHGIQTRIGENGAYLSGGQRQRLALARAFYRDAPIIILDEATSALDSETETTIKEAMRRLLIGRTAIIIAHRFSTIDFADRIIVLDGGKIIASGTVATLRHTCPLFAELYDAQII